MLLLSIIQMSQTLKNVVSAITIPGMALTMSALLGVVVIYIFALFGFWFFSSDFFNEDQSKNECETLLLCLTSFLHNGLIAGGGIADYLGGELGNPPSLVDSNAYTKRIIYDLMFFILVIVLLLNIIFGIIIDTFSALREDAAEKQQIMKNSCFICGLGKDLFDEAENKSLGGGGSGSNSGVGGFEGHIRTQHNMWDYISYMIYIRTKDETEYSGLESYIAQLFSNDDLSWIPRGSALMLRNASSGDNDEDEATIIAERNEELLENILGVLRENQETMIGQMEEQNIKIRNELGGMKAGFSRLKGEVSQIQHHVEQALNNKKR